MRLDLGALTTARAERRAAAQCYKPHPGCVRPGCVKAAPPLLQRDRQTNGQTDGQRTVT